MKEIKVSEIDKNVLKAISEEWMLVGATNCEKSNVMTASWGGMGYLWNKNVVFVFIRPQRYTKEFVDASEYFSLSFFDAKYRDMLTYMGRTSGRDEDKIAKCNLTALQERAPLFEQASMTFICKKLYKDELSEDGFMQKDIVGKNYTEKDFHAVYIAEILKVYVN